MSCASTSYLTIERLDDVIEYEEFLRRFLVPNVPCVLPAKMTQDWPASKGWTTSGTRSETDAAQSGQLDGSFDVLSRLYAHHAVPVVMERLDCSEDADERTIRHENVDLHEAVELLRDGKRSGNERSYIKDWHLVRQERMLQTDEDAYRPPYETPSLFADDWMNNSADEDADDFRFCYAGVAGTRTNIHRDVYTSYSWSTNIVGVKQWRLFPPKVKRHLRMFPGSETSELASCVDKMEDLRGKGRLGLLADGCVGWPEWPEAMQACFEVIQQPGETIFVPSDWHHEVTNLTDCISLNHNWCNATNIASMYWAMCEEVEQVEDALDDVREMMLDAAISLAEFEAEWTETVQRVAKANSGWAWNGFWTMVEHNLVHPACPSSFRPSFTYVKSQLTPCLQDFLTRHDFAGLDGNTKLVAGRCKALLDLDDL